MKCKSCGKEIIWIKMYGSGKKMPVDAEPVAWDDDPEADIVSAYRSHFATCPDADKHRKRGA